LFHPAQIFDDHIAFAADYLPAGSYELTYTLVSVQSGQFRVLPARAWQFYFPDVRGSSAGAMVLCEFYFDPISEKVHPGLNLLPEVCVLPHHDTFGKDWAPRLSMLLPGALLIGIDEDTGLLNDGPNGQWTVYGKGAVTVYEPDGRAVFHHGQRFALPVEIKDHL
jgi:hypothetical protein